ncbi:transporter substrate-binding domain-containing protein [Aquimarina sp. D1M17]|uniref:hybrid sensor histidine kinase/response regulator n=1 Tax=Aquimarina acroporae TaxID=2937283 RepID=UPI0020BEDEE8|nr:transporter substrate-binding domain-containing protein [Aquimarina acroporae]MCK8522923.1 transporter substrate-binding domain-containing protein [Aquimarina acroporae]
MLKKLLFPILLVLVLIVYFSCSRPSSTLTEEEHSWLQNNNVTVALFPYYAPYQFINENEKIDGILIDYLDLIEQKAGHKFERKLYSNWEQLLDDTKNNKVDIVLEIQETLERDAYLNFYAQLFKSNFVIVTRKDNNSGVNLKDYYNKTITVPKDYGIHEILKENEKGLPVATEIDDKSCLVKLNDGKYDAYIGPKAVANFIIKTENLNNLEIVGETGYVYMPSLAVQNNNSLLNGIIEKIQNDIDEKDKNLIFDNWLYLEIVPFYKKANFWIMLSLVILLFSVVVLLLNKYLKYLIGKKTEELHIAKERAEESNKLKTAFIHNISHEVRTPMNGIIGFSELLNDPEITSEKQKEYSKIIIDSSNQLITIIDDIIEISRLQTNQVELQLEETNFNSVLQILFTEFQSKAISKNIAIHLDNKLTDEQGTILMDRAKINKILSNLIDNAIKFTKKGIVEISSYIEKDNLIISIQDTGIGIKSEDQEIIFRNFSQSEKDVTKSYDGLGLGLSIAQKNAELIKGKITFTSIPTKGSTFTVSVPYLPIFDPNKANKPEIEHLPSENIPIKQVILIVEDGDVNFLFLKTILQKMKGYKFVIHRAENGKKAVDICENNENIDLILMDIRMPVMDGYTATKKIKKIRPKLPIIAQTAYSTEEDVQRALEAGCDDFVAKPVDRKILKPIINKYFAIFSK